MYDYARTAGQNFECRNTGIGLAWIDSKGEIHHLRHNQTHAEWAAEFLREDFNWDLGNKLMKIGWIRVTNLFVWQMFRPSRQARATAVKWMTHCAIKGHLDLEKVSIVVEAKKGNVKGYSPADFVKEFGGRKAENALFTQYYESWQLRAASYNYDRRVSGCPPTAQERQF